jgi:hypothetical protein
LIPDKDDGIVVLLELEVAMIHGLKVDVKADGHNSKDENRVNPVDNWPERIDRRFDEQRSDVEKYFDALRADYRKLYDFFEAQGERMDARFDQLETEIRTGCTNLQNAIRALSRAHLTGGRRRR